MILSFRGKKPLIPASCYISENVNIIGDVILGDEVNIWFGAVIRGDMHYIRIGARTNIQDNCTSHVTTDVSPTILGDEVTVGHNAMIHGCTVENCCLIGMGAILLDDAIIGEGSIIGAGALVPPKMVVPPRSLCLGIPARIIRSVSDTEYQENIASAQQYIDFANLYKNK